ncbi:MAG TPA: SGNH/GDSL hydrolase family protein [Planctomycetaceae bacterium]|nr:SGNH/GDSL hydrolase family protein [Planctomycetaceae bacterium]
MTHFSRRSFLHSAAVGLGGLALLPRNSSGQETKPTVSEGVAWYNVEDWGVEGKGFDDTIRYFDRLPGRAEKTVRGPVWSLSRHSAGMLVRFETDASDIHVKYDLLSSNVAMPHMPATGVSGVDLYGRNETGQDRWVKVSRPTAQHVEEKLVSGIDQRPNGKPRLYTLYLPLYNGVEKLEIGVPEGTGFVPVAPREQKPIVFYGTSIMHGACASRPGMSISALVGRRFHCPTINLGFSGNGRMEIEVGEFLAELDPSVYCIDCLPNMSEKDVAERTEPLVKLLRQARPGTPIVLVEDRTYTNAPFFKSMRDRHAGSRQALRAAYENLKREGVEHLSYLEGDIQLGDDGEAATDGSHPNDLGFIRYADAYETVLKPILGV